MSLETIALVALCCLGGVITVILLPLLLPLLLSLLQILLEGFEGVVSGRPCCIFGCLALTALCVLVVAVFFMLFQDACSATNPPFFCDLIGP